jgi:uncharacterized membrane protein YdjX (TVP38/TMEM64 family)
MADRSMKTVGADRTDRSAGCRIAGISGPLSDELSASPAARSASGAGAAGPRRAVPWRLLIGGAVLLAAVAASIVWRGPLGSAFAGALGWIERLGPPAFVAFIGLYVVATVLLVPGVVLTLGAGAMFGLGWGAAAVSAGSTLGAAAAFGIGRTVARGAVRRRLDASPRFAALDEAVGREGFQIVLLTRLSPLFPFSLQNYAYALTAVRFWPYLLASWLGMLPGTLLYVYIGTTLGEFARLAADGRPKPWYEWAFFGAGLAVTAAATVFVTRVARKALHKAAPKAASG